MSDVTRVRAYSAYELAHFAESLAPSSLTSAGAEFLLSLRDDVIEAWEDGRFVEEDEQDIVVTLAMAAPAIANHTMWHEFVDLSAWQEDFSEIEDPPRDPEGLARLALYQIAERLGSAVVGLLRA